MSSKNVIEKEITVVQWTEIILSYLLWNPSQVQPRITAFVKMGTIKWSCYSIYQADSLGQVQRLRLPNWMRYSDSYAFVYRRGTLLGHCLTGKVSTILTLRLFAVYVGREYDSSNSSPDTVTLQLSVLMWVWRRVVRSVRGMWVLSKECSLYAVLVNKLIVPEPIISFELSHWFILMFNYSATSKQLLCVGDKLG